MSSHKILIGILAVMTYFSRMLGAEVMARRQISPALRRYFACVPAAVMAALIIKQVFLPAGEGITLSLPVLAACLAAGLTMKSRQSFLPSAAVGLLAGLLVRIAGA